METIEKIWVIAKGDDGPVFYHHDSREWVDSPIQASWYYNHSFAVELLDTVKRFWKETNIRGAFIQEVEVSSKLLFNDE